MRDETSFREHLEKVVGNCCKSWVVLGTRTLLGDEYCISPHLCKSSYCPVCRPRKLIALRRRLYDTLKGERWRLLTLTFKDHGKNKTDQFVQAHGMLKKTIQRIRRQYKGVKYARVFEIHKSGFPHVHMITNQYIPVKFLSGAWQACGGGHVEIREPRCTKCGGSLPCVEHNQKKYASYKQAGIYLTEELDPSKKYQDPYRLGVEFWSANVKSVMTSRNLPLAKDLRLKEWRFLGSARDQAEAMQMSYELVMYDHVYNGKPRPSIDYGKNRIKIGFGFEDSPDVHFDFGTKIEQPGGWMP